MSRSVDLFIDSPLELDALARCLGALMRIPFTPVTDRNIFELREGHTVAELGEHSYVDDGALRLSRYRYNLSARFSAAAAVNASPEVALVRHAAELVRERIGIPVLIVIDLEQRDPGPDRETRPARPGERETRPERPGERETGPERPGERETGPERPGERETGPERPGERETGPAPAASAPGGVER
ncbi:MAG TPA: hypothetical protein VG184_10055 [Acidimicrobiales bacterium]|nr:hypothetical protein [Acidimicrobiales bacterium]